MISTQIMLAVMAYGIIVICTFFSFLILTAATYNEFSYGLPGEFCGYQEVVMRMMHLLGFTRCIYVGIVALIWPVLVATFAMLLIRNRYISDPEPLSSHRQPAILWLFLGFGKFPPINYYPR